MLLILTGDFYDSLRKSKLNAIKNGFCLAGISMNKLNQFDDYGQAVTIIRTAIKDFVRSE